MKKNRPGTLLRVICRPGDSGPLTDILLRRRARWACASRSWDACRCPRGSCCADSLRRRAHQKPTLGDGTRRAAPEYDDCRRLAEATGAPLRDVYRAAERVAEQAV